MVDMRWRACSPEDLLWVSWEEDFTVYNRATGETHLLNALPAEIVHILGKQPLTARALSEKMAQLCETENSLEWSQRINQVLSDLAALSLVEPACR